MSPFQSRATNAVTWGNELRWLVFALVLSILSSLVVSTPSQASVPSTLTTCVNLITLKERISKNGTCRTPQEAIAKWQIASTDSALSSEGTPKTLSVCSNKENSPVTYQLIRTSCAKNMKRSLYIRAASIPARPIIRNVSSLSHESASLTLAVDSSTIKTAPITYFTVTTNQGNVTKINSWNDLTLTINGLRSSTSYTFTVTATNVDGTSPVSAPSNPVTTQLYIAPTPVANSSPPAASATGAVLSTQPSGATNGSTFATQPVIRIVDANGNTSTSFAGNVTATIASGSGTLSGTTTIAAVSGVATYTNLAIVGTSGNFTLRFTPSGLTSVDSSSFALSFGTATKVAITRASAGTQRNTAFTTQPQITIRDSGNNTVASSTASISASISAGGTLIGTHTVSASSGIATFDNLGVNGTIGTTYTITYTAVGLTVATASVTLSGTTCNGSTFVCQVGDTGPGGGTIFYVAQTTFTQVDAGAGMCSTECKYLEAAPNTWSGGSDPAKLWAVSAHQNTDVSTITNDASSYNNTNAIGLGYKNSLAIVAQGNDVTTAAGAARGYAGGSKSDWYLPTTAELNQLCKWARGVAWTSDATVCAGGTLTNGGFAGSYYWSSSEYDANLAWSQWFRSGPQFNDNKNFTWYVRPIRAFGQVSLENS
jgi:hypothetical protein